MFQKRLVVLVGVMVAWAIVFLASQVLAAWPSDPAVNLPICTAPGGQWSPAVIQDDTGGVYVVWEDYRGGNIDNKDIYAQHVLANGTTDPAWPVNGLAICTAPGNQYLASLNKQGPTMVSDGVGGALITWQDCRSGICNGIYAQHVLANGTTDPAWPVNGLNICSSINPYSPASSPDDRPTIASDGAGGAIVAWEDYRHESEIYAQHVLANGTTDPAWPVNGQSLVYPYYGTDDPTMVSDDAGGAIVIWRDWRYPGKVDIYAQRVSATGVPLWPTNGVAIYADSTHTAQYDIVPDGAGGAIIMWWDYRTTVFNVYAQHINDQGVPLWTPNGVKFSSSSCYHRHPAIIPDGRGGAFMAWEDTLRNTCKIYAQRINAEGVPQWTANGTAICPTGVQQGFPMLASDGRGGAIVAWLEDRTNSYNLDDIYAQHVLANGTTDPVWPASGRAICTSGEVGIDPVIIPDDAGGAIIVWEDYRNISTDIYAQRVQPNGQLGGDVVSVLVSLVSADADNRRVRLTWYTADANLTASLYRRIETDGWRFVATVTADGKGLVLYEDYSIEPGKRHCYRLGIQSGAGEQFLGETCISVSSTPTLFLEGLRPNPADRDVVVSFSLSTSEPATVELVDLAGRIVSRHIIEAKPGSFVVKLSNGRTIAPGIYLVRLTQGGRSISRKACIVH